MNAAQDAAIATRSVALAWGSSVVVHDVSFDVRPREIVALLGESGSGKTTLLRALAGLHRVHAGAISVAGRLVDEASSRTWVPPERRSVGVVFQDYALFPNMSVVRNVAFGAAAGVEPEALLARVGLRGYGDRRVTQLSGGEQQRVAVARVLAQQPAVVLLDEPFSHLNPSLRLQLRDDTLGVIRDCGAAAVLVTHDAEEALGASDRIAVLRAGRLLQFDTPQRVYRQPSCLACAEATGDALAVSVDGTGASPLGRLETTGTGPLAVVRPEQLVVADEGAGVEARVLHCAFLGHGVRATIEIGGQRCRMTVPEHLDRDELVRVRVSGSCHRVDG